MSLSSHTTAISSTRAKPTSSHVQMCWATLAHGPSRWAPLSICHYVAHLPLVPPLQVSYVHNPLGLRGIAAEILENHIWLDRIMRSLPKLPICGIRHAVHSNATIHQNLGHPLVVDEAFHVQQLDVKMLLLFRVLDHCGWRTKRAAVSSSSSSSWHAYSVGKIKTMLISDNGFLITKLIGTKYPMKTLFLGFWLQGWARQWLEVIGELLVTEPLNIKRKPGEPTGWR